MIKSGGQLRQILSRSAGRFSRKWVFGALLVVFVVTFLIQAAGVRSRSSRPETTVVEPTREELTAQLQPWMDTSTSLNFPYPMTLGRDNLRSDSFYLTAFLVAGFTNKFIDYMQLIYLAVLSDRIPIVPPILPPGWVPETAGMLPFGTVFNLTNLRAALRKPVLEWADVKKIPSDAFIQDPVSPTDPNLEHFGCWSTRGRTFPVPTPVKHAENVLKLDLSFTRVPAIAYYNSSDPAEIHTLFSALSTIVHPRHPHPSSRNLPLLTASRFNSTLPPDDHLACFDLLYFVSSGVRRYEFENPWSPAWNTIGTHLTFNRPLMDLTETYFRKALKLSESDPIPPMITIHIRRNDFKFKCKNGQEPPCFMPMHKYRDALVKMQRELREIRHLQVDRVFVASDETDPKFWEEMTSYGWSYFDHIAERTVERYGDWYPLLLDKVALSMGVGFIGTEPSTFSALNAMRVADWNNGITKLLSYHHD